MKFRSRRPFEHALLLRALAKQNLPRVELLEFAQPVNRLLPLAQVGGEVARAQGHLREIPENGHSLH
jgi:hypothetical protein